MGDQHRILDVTYGKFSCRLEGFDDAVETMKTIVTFFREVAGDQIFLEPTPSIPDLDTIAKLAQAQSGGTVTAHPSENGVSLVRTEQDAPAAEETVADQDDEAVAEIADEDESVMAAGADLPEHVVADDEDTAEEWSEEHDTLMLDEGETELADLRGSFDTDIDNIADEISADLDDETMAEDELSVTDDLDMAAEAAEEDDAPEVQSDMEDVAYDEADALDVAEDSDVSAEEDDDLPLAAAEEAEEAAEDDAPQAAAWTAPKEDQDNLASRLDRIRAMVSKGISAEDAPVAPVAAAPAPTPASDTPSRPLNPLAQRLAELAKRNSELMDADAREQAPQMTDDEDDWDDDIEDDAVAAADDSARDDEAAWDSDDDLYDEDDADEIAAESDFDDADDLDDDEDVAEASDDSDDAHDEPVRTAEVRSLHSDRPLLLTTPQRPDLRAQGDTPEDDDDFDLTAELAKVEEEIAARPRNELSRHGLPRRVEDAMSRIFSQTNQQLDEPEGRRHRDALAQLKAAVAATEAAKQMGDSQKSRDAGETFRDDLGALHSESGQTSQPLPPLKLVRNEVAAATEQSVPQPRVTSKPLDVAAERLREIAAAKETAKDASKSVDFVAFLEQHGVSDLADKLEAAAAYLAFVEGEPDFTRPQLMRLVQSASREEVTREDGLRCFGRLLRQARFLKLSNGRFQVSDNTRFRPRKSRVAQG